MDNGETMTARRSTLGYWFILLIFSVWACINLRLLRLSDKVLGGLSGSLPADFYLAGSPGRKLGSRRSPFKPKTLSHRALSIPVTNELCGGCRKIVANPKVDQTCGFLIYRTAKRENISLVEAARWEVEQHNSTDCRPCLPESCDKHAKNYWRYDDVAPSILAAKSSYLSSIRANQHRLPTSLLAAEPNDNQLIDYFTQPQSSYPDKRYLFEYNPSLVILPQDQIPEEYYIPGGESPVYYLASYRVTNQQSCFHPNVTLAMIGGSWQSRPKQRDYLALALLRSDLSILQDVVVDLPKQCGFKEDFRLFVLHGQVFLGSYCWMAPLWLSNPRSLEGKQVLRQVFPSALRVVMGKNMTWCSSYWKDWESSKNLNYFVDADNHTVVEMFPIGPRTLHKVGDPLRGNSETPPHPYSATIDSTVPPPSFHTMEELDLGNRHSFFESPFTTDRGGACCVPISDPRRSTHGNSNLLLGISHTKTPFQRKKLENITEGNHYLSRFYAFENEAPYRVVALSGYFCLPANPFLTDLASTGTDGNAGHDTDHNPLVGLPLWRPLSLGGTTYLECPAIHFVTGMTEKAGDNSRMIVAYGVSDCTSWFIEVDKSDVIELLFFGPSSSEGQQ